VRSKIYNVIVLINSQTSNERLTQMRIYLITALLIISCNNQEPGIKNNTDTTSGKKIITALNNENNKDMCWAGTLNGGIPIFIHYQLDSNIIIGEITYRNTKEQLPIKLLGTIEEDKSYRLLEFDKHGNISGTIVGKATSTSFTGTWISPQTRKEFVLKLVPKDTLISSPSFKPDSKMLFGKYHYQYGENGYQGDFELSKVNDTKAAFQIISLTDVEKGPNTAEIPKDTINFKGDNFIYKLPGSDNCEFKVTFYKDFVYINYTKGDCESQFGLNATIDGIFLKVQ
jgi:hypothetical protein